MISGPISDFPRTKLSCVNLTNTHVLKIDSRMIEDRDVIMKSSDESLAQQAQTMWDLDSIGISRGDTVYETFQKTVTFENGHYKVKLPWREHHNLLPDNYELSLKHLSSLIHRLKDKPCILHEYDRTIREQINQGIVEEVKPTLAPLQGNLHFLSHHGVLRKDTVSTKLCIVLDASARLDSRSPSLNQCQ